MKDHLEFACFADSPLHVFNIVNLVWHNVEGTYQNCDLFIHKQFSGYDGMIDSLRDAGIFRNVYECNLPTKSEESKNWHSFIRLIELFTPKRCLNNWTGGVEVSEKYDVILMPAPLRFSIALYDVNRQADIWFYEDGSVNYYGNVLEQYGPKYKHILKVLFNKGHETINPTRIYVNNKSLSYPTDHWETIQLPKFDVHETEFIELLKKIFGVIPDNSRKKIIYLSVPLSDVHAGEGVNPVETLKETLLPLNSFSDDIIVRPHPREKNQNYFGLPVEETSVFWELFCAFQVKSENILIGYYSTAQLMPKLLFDEEPYLIFIYKLFNSIMSEKKAEELNTLIERIKKAYRNPEKIYVINTAEEYNNVLKLLLQ